MNQKEEPQTYWITNISDRNISVGDLRLTIGRGQSVNLLSNHYHFTFEELEASRASGSLYNHREVLKLRKIPPQPIEKPQMQVHKGPRAKTRIDRPIVKVEVVRYEELEFSDEKYAMESLEAALSDVGNAVLPKK